MSDKRQKLYRVTLRGMTHSSTGVIHGVSYVVAYDPEHAYRVVRNDMDKRNIGFKHDRELLSVELIAEDYAYTECKTRLYV